MAAETKKKVKPLPKGYFVDKEGVLRYTSGRHTVSSNFFVQDHGDPNRFGLYDNGALIKTLASRS